MISALLSRLVILVFGTLYPAYASYKAIKEKDLKGYMRWMMYWVTFALFTAMETFTDIFVSFWFPFYYEVKIVLMFWLLSPITKGSNIIYKKIVHAWFEQHEKEIDEYIARVKDQGCNALYGIGTKGLTMATNAIRDTALMNAITFLLTWLNHNKRDEKDGPPSRDEDVLDVTPKTTHTRASLEVQASEVQMANEFQMETEEVDVIMDEGAGCGDQQPFTLYYTSDDIDVSHGKKSRKRGRPKKCQEIADVSPHRITRSSTRKIRAD